MKSERMIRLEKELNSMKGLERYRMTSAERIAEQLAHRRRCAAKED